MPQGRHFGASSDTMQQVHGAGVKSNVTKQYIKIILMQYLHKVEAML
jgi:hypothetical protein